MTKLEKFKQLLGVEDDSKDFNLQFILDKVEDEIKNYCHLQTLPSALDNVVLDISMQLYRLDNLTTADAEATVKSIQVGDTTTTFENVNVHKVIQDSLKTYASRIAPFRKVRW